MTKPNQLWGLLVAVVLIIESVLLFGAMKPQPIPDTKMTQLRTLVRSITPLHKKKALPRPGDWLARFKEPGQTFEEYVRSNPNRPSKKLTTIYLQPIGNFDEQQQKLIDATADVLGRFYGVPVKKLDCLPLSVIPKDARRMNWGAEQILTGFVEKLLIDRRPKDAVALIALTTSDLWPGAGWNFVFGEATLTERVGVWSIHRFGDPKTEYTQCLRRTIATAIHETGHMLGILHCVPWECGMNGSNSLEEADRQPLAFCPECELKIWWACPVKPVERYKSLAEFAEKNGLIKEMEFWRVAERQLPGK